MKTMISLVVISVLVAFGAIVEVVYLWAGQAARFQVEQEAMDAEAEKAELDEAAGKTDAPAAAQGVNMTTTVNTGFGQIKEKDDTSAYVHQHLDCPSMTADLEMDVQTGEPAKDTAKKRLADAEKALAETNARIAAGWVPPPEDGPSRPAAVSPASSRGAGFDYRHSVRMDASNVSDTTTVNGKTKKRSWSAGTSAN